MAENTDEEGAGLLHHRLEKFAERESSYRYRQAMYSIYLGLGNAADASEIVCLGFIMTELEDELTKSEKGLLSSAVFIGMLVGGLLWGSLADIFGRKRGYVWALQLATVADLLSVFAPNVSVLIIARVLAGLGIGGSVPNLYAFGKEIFVEKRSGELLSIVSAFWMVGALFVACAGWIMLGVMDAGWRAFAFVAALPSIAALVAAMWGLPESPRFLMKCYEKGTITHKDVWKSISWLSGSPMGTFEASSDPLDSVEAMDEALGWMEEADDKNVSVSGIAYDVCEASTGVRTGLVRSETEANVHSTSAPSRAHASESSSANSTRNPLIGRGTEDGSGRDSGSKNATTVALAPAPIVTWATLIEPFEVIVDPDLRKPLLVLSAVQYTLSFGSFGLSTWISTLFYDIGIKDVYMNSFIFSVASIPGNIFTVYYMDSMGYLRMMTLGMFASAVSCLAFALEHKAPWAVVLFASIFNMNSIVAWNALDIACVNAVPLESRSSVYAVLSALGRVGAICAQFVNATLEDSVGLLLFVTTSCMFAGGICSYLLEDKQQQQQFHGNRLSTSSE